MIAVASDVEWQRLCQALGYLDWARTPQYATVAKRVDHQDELDRHLTAWTQIQDARHAMEDLQAHSVAAGMVFQEPDAYDDPHLNDRGFLKLRPNTTAAPIVTPACCGRCPQPRGTSAAAHVISASTMITSIATS